MQQGTTKNKKNLSAPQRPCGIEKEYIKRDFQRDVYALFGLPIDNLTLQETKSLLRKRAQQEGTMVLSTINVNWVVQSLKNPDFRKAILNSDLVTLDGRPLLWLAKLLDFPMTEVVAGSTLIQELNQERSEKPLSIFFFGGEDEAGRLAMERVNSTRGGLKGVGFLNPGFGTVAEMSRPEIIEQINQASPDILLVALGAVKGTQWIKHNRHQLNAKVISHLGATINFLAGTVKRAPGPVRKLGLEWAWRILQEPKLFFRYAGDGLVLLKMLLGRLPLWWRYRSWSKSSRLEPDAGTGRWQENERTATLSFGRHLRAEQNPLLRDLLARAARADRDLMLDFQATEYMDGAFLGLLLLLQKQQQKNGKKLIFNNMQGRPARIFHLFENRYAGT